MSRRTARTPAIRKWFTSPIRSGYLWLLILASICAVLFLRLRSPSGNQPTPSDGGPAATGNSVAGVLTSVAYIAAIFVLIWLWMAWRNGVLSIATLLARRARKVARAGNPEAASELLRRARAWVQWGFGRSVRRARQLWLVADAHRELCHYADALPIYERAIAILEGKGKEHAQDMAAACNNLTICESDRGQFDAAIGLYNRAFEAAATAPPSQRWVRPLILVNASQTEAERGRLDSARDLLVQAQESVLAFPGQRTTRTLELMIASGLAIVEADAGNLTPAEKHAEGALQLISPPDKSSMPLRPQALLALAHVRWRQERLDETGALVTESLEILRRTHEPENAKTSKYYLLAGQAQIAAGEWTQAEDSFRHAFSLRQRRGYPDTPNIADHLRSFAALLRRTGQSTEADEVEQRANAARVAFERETTGIKAFGNGYSSPETGIEEKSL